METNFTKKIFKILTIAIFSVFVFNLAEAETKITTRLDENGATITDVTETTYENRKEQTSGFGSGYITTREETKSFYNYKGDNTDEQYGETQIKEVYTNEKGIDYEQSGSLRYNDSGAREDYWGGADGGNFEGSAYEYKEGSGKGKFTYTLLQPLPREGTDLSENVTLKQYLTWAFRFVLALAGFLVVMMIVIGGVEYIISGASEASRSDAKKRINNAISGLVLALVSYLVLYTINPSLVDFKNNQFFKEKETTSSSNTSNNTNNTTASDDETRWNEDSTSNIGDFNDTITDMGDVPI